MLSTMCVQGKTPRRGAVNRLGKNVAAARRTFQLLNQSFRIFERL
ncbi:hypothetical protein [Falsiroseomonas sp.]